MAEEHADELMVAHMDGRMCAAQPIDAMLGEQAELRRLSDCCPELNLSNYGPDDVDELNWWAIEVSQCIDRALAAQPAGAQQPGAGTWTPLPGTLPEPGKPVLLDIGKEYPIRAMWAAKFTLLVGMEDDSGFGDHDELTDEWYCPEGWYEWNEHEECHWRVDETPVSWCELPPKEQK